MNETTGPLPAPSVDPVDAAIQAALNPDAQSPAPVPETPSEGNVEPPKPEVRKAREYAEAAEQKRRAVAAETRARQQAKEFQAQQAALTKEKAELEELFKAAKGNKQALQKLMDRAGMNIDDFARTLLDLDALPATADSKAEQALEEARALRKQLDEERAQYQEAQKQAQSKAAFDKYVEVAKAELSKDTTNEFELILEAQAFPTVLERCFVVLEKHGMLSDTLTPEEESALIIHCAKEVEAEFLEQATIAAARIKKSAKGRNLLGITGDNTTASSETIRNDDEIAALDPESSKLLESMARDTTAVPRGNKFITQESTISSRPASVVASRRSDSDNEIDALVKAMAGKKPF